MIDIVVFMGLLAVGLLMMAVWQSRMSGWERRYVWMSFGAHVFSAIAMVLLTQYFFGGGDLFAYQQRGAQNALLLQSDFGEYAWDFVLFTLGFKPSIRLDFATTSTGSMIGLSTWLHLLLLGSVYGKCLLIAMLGVPSKYYLYKGMASFFHASCHRFILLGCMLLPSTVFWTSGMLKEPMAMLGMGPLMYGTACLIQGRRRLLSVMLVMCGGFTISIFKAYILFPWLSAAALAYFWQRQITTGKGAAALLKQPVYLVIVFIIAIGGVWMLGEIFPRYSINTLTDELSKLQSIGQRTGGGSNYTLTASPSRGQNAQLALLPVGLFFSLFRPFFFEVSNAALLLNAVETTGFLVLWFRIIRRGIGSTLKLALKTPGVMFAVVFVILFGSIVGIATTNVGTLSRYRIPMMPFYVSLLLIFHQQTRVRSRSRG